MSRSLSWNPNFTPKSDTIQEKAAKVTIRHNVWNLELAFKPLRMVHVDIPQTTGKMQRKLIWYMVYRVRNLGGHLNPVPVAEKPNTTETIDQVMRTFKPEAVDQVLNAGAAAPSNTIRFFPHFVLESPEVGKAYLDRIIPAAMPVIQLREMRGAKLYNSVEISQVSIPVVPRDGGPGLWGVVTWEDVDPQIDFFSIYVQGITNAFRLEPSADGENHPAAENAAAEFLAAERHGERTRGRNSLRSPLGDRSERAGGDLMPVTTSLDGLIISGFIAKTTPSRNQPKSMALARQVCNGS